MRSVMTLDRRALSLGLAWWMSSLGLAAAAHGQCTVLLRDTFHFGERPHGGDGRLRVVDLEDRLNDFWPEVSAIGARWMSSDNINQPLWQFSWSCCDPSEISPLEPADAEFGQGTVYGESGAAVVIPFVAPPSPFTLSINFSDVDARVGYTSSPSFLDNFATNGALWMSINSNVEWVLYANGSQVVGSGLVTYGGGALHGAFYRIEMTYDPVQMSVYGSVAGEPFGPFPVTLTVPIAYFGMEGGPTGAAHLNNLSIYTGAPVVTTISGPSNPCMGCTAELVAQTNAAAPLGSFWHFNGLQILEDGVLPSGASVSGVRSSTLTISHITPDELGTYTCVIANDCGLTSSAAYVLAEHCVADVDDGSASGVPDGGVTIDDLLYYLYVFEAGLPSGDIDNGTSTGTPDGGVTIDDLLYYLIRFEGGC